MTRVHMNEDDLPTIRLTRQDAGRLDALLADCPRQSTHSGVELLLRELLRADVVPSNEVPAETVVMHSVVTYLDRSSGLTQTVTLVYPSERSLLPNGLSVLAPIGAALIGLSEGQSISFVGIDGKLRTITVQKVHSQPAGSSRQ